MRRLALLFVGATIWLFLAALPALADGGPHVVSVNDGSLGINADGCAGCHRAHTATGPYLINAASEEDLCLTCHGSAGVGSTVDVMTGVQYKTALPPGSPGQNPNDPTVLLGALRNGGFDQARIDAGEAVRLSYFRSATAASNRPFVGVGAPEDVTSAHISMVENGLEMPGIAWGNGPISATANPGAAVVDLSCANCHNPHGNGQFRILNPIPEVADPAAAVDPDVVDFVLDTTENAVVDSPTVNPDAAESDVKNYTIIQGQLPNYYPFADDVLDAGYTAADGDYFRRTVPWASTADWNPITGIAGNVFTTQYPHQLTTATGLGAGDAYISGVSGLADGMYEVSIVPSATTFVLSGVTVANQTPAAAFVSRIGGGASNWDAPNGMTGTGGFLDQMTMWCTSCHTRYLADGNFPVAGNPYNTDSGDAIFHYRHPTRQNRTCTNCHVSHGTNAAMPGDFSSSVEYPDGSIPLASENGNSRLLKIDNRGTCQACHDPTETTGAGDFYPTGADFPDFP